MKLLKVVAALLCAVGISASASVPTATLTDTDGQVWSNCQFTATLSASSGGAYITPTVGGVPVSPLSVSGTCNASGVLTATLTDTSTVQQAGAQWVFSIRPNVSLVSSGGSQIPATVVSTTVVGASPDLSAAFNALPAPRFSAGPNAYGYADVEVLRPVIGDTYFNTGSVSSINGVRKLSLAGWTGGGGGSGGGAVLPSSGVVCATSTTVGVTCTAASIVAGIGATPVANATTSAATTDARVASALQSGASAGGGLAGTYPNPTLTNAGVIAGLGYTPATLQSGSGTPQGLTCNSGPGQIYTNTVNAQNWVCSTNAAVWTNQVTGVVVYAGAATMLGLTNNYEMNEGTGTTLTDNAGSTNLTIGGGAGGVPAWNSTNGLTYTGALSQYVVVPQSFWTQHSTFMFCFKSTSMPSGDSSIFQQISSSSSGGIAFDPVTFTPFIGLATGGIASSYALTPVTFNVPICMTVVYNGAGADQFWIGQTKLPIRLANNSFSAIATNMGLGGPFAGFIGTIYKFGASVGTELAPDQIQHNNLVQSAKIAIATSLTTATTPVAYQNGGSTIWCIGDSRTFGFTGTASSYCNYLPADIKLSNTSVYNGGIPTQTLATYITEGIFSQAGNVASQRTIPGSPTPTHLVTYEMGTNDFGLNNATGAAAYANFVLAIGQLKQADWKVIAFSTAPNALNTSTQNTNRAAYNVSLANGGLWDGFVDWSNDLKMSNPSFTYDVFGKFSPYMVEGTHWTNPAAVAMKGRLETEMNRIGLVGTGSNFNPTCPTAFCDIDMRNGSSQQISLSTNVTVLKVINGNQGSRLDLTITQPTSGGPFTVPTVAVGSGATATVTSAGVMTLTAGGSNYDQNFMPVLYASGLTCTTYPRYSSTITSGAIASITQLVAGAGCSGTGTVVFVPTEPVWNNFNSAAVNALTAGQSLKQSFVFDGVGQSINENSNNVAIGGVLGNANAAVGTGAGTGGTATLSGLDSAHILTIATGTLPTLSASVATVTYTANRGHVSYCSLTPANASTALLTGASMVFMSANSATAYTVTAGATALTAATTYAWNVTCP